MTFVQNFWNRWNTNHLAFVREMRQNIVDMFVNDDTKVKKCPSNIDKVNKDRDRNKYWDTESGRTSKNTRSVCSVRSVSKRRSSRSVSREKIACTPEALRCPAVIRPSRRYYLECKADSGDNTNGGVVGEENQWNCTSCFEFVIVITLTLICMVGSFAGTVYWIMTKHSPIGFPWDKKAKGNKLLYFHPMAMVGGFILLSGFSILTFRLCRCCKRLCVKIIHLFFHLLAAACIGLGAWAIFNHHKKEKLHLYSIHSWVGILAIGLFALQFVFGTLFFLFLLICEGPTAGCRASLIPVHAALGLASYILAICACILGLNERVITIMGKAHKKKITSAKLEQQIMYGIVAALALLAVLIIYICRKENFRCRHNHKRSRDCCD